ncbi:MAG: hypothetical protein K2N16_06520 [Muribaculaceae bacterium]|nr:hypothetical protein [Muribaculaceae bacterium]
MAFEFDETSTELSTIDYEKLRYEVCDALQFDSNGQMVTTSKILNEGYYRKGYYMLFPFWYQNHFNEKNTDTIFLRISRYDKLESIDVEQLEPMANPETIEYMPIVVFRNHQHPICNPKLEGTDLSEGYCWCDDTYEFVGVYSAKKVPGENCYRLTEIFDRYYFDKSKLTKS